MNTLSQNSYECLSGSVLKVIAAVSMLQNQIGVLLEMGMDYAQV